jgi:hypothetical protein
MNPVQLHHRRRLHKSNLVEHCRSQSHLATYRGHLLMSSPLLGPLLFLKNLPTMQATTERASQSGPLDPAQQVQALQIGVQLVLLELLPMMKNRHQNHRGQELANSIQSLCTRNTRKEGQLLLQWAPGYRGTITEISLVRTRGLRYLEGIRKIPMDTSMIAVSLMGSAMAQCRS